MLASELIEYLQERIDLQGDCEVRLANQPSWPFEYAIKAVVSSTELADAQEDPEATETEPGQLPVIYIVEGRQLGYGTKRLWGEF